MPAPFEIRPALECGAQVHHVALISEWRPERTVKIRQSDKSVDGKTASSQVIEPAREQHREPSVAIDVRRRSELARHEGKIRLSKRIDDVADGFPADGIEIFPGHVNLDAATGPPQNDGTAT